RTGVLDPLPADAPPARLLSRVVGVGGPGVDDAARRERPHRRELVQVGVVGVFWILLGVEVVEVSIELVEAVYGRQEAVEVAEVVLAELTGGVAERLEQLGDRGILGLEADGRARHADFA